MSEVSNNLFKEGFEIIREEGSVALVKRIPRAAYARILPLESRIGIRLRLQALRGYTVLSDPLKPIHVDPNRLKYSSNARFVPEKYYVGRILSGDWDKQRTRLENTDTYQGLYDRFVDGRPWEETAYYERAKDAIEAEGEYLGYTCADEFLESRCRFVDELYYSLHKNGYQSVEKDRPNDSRRPWSNKDPTEISVVIGRNGKMLLHDGHHRLVLSQFLDLDEIPIHILIRHEKWQQRREAIASKADCEQDNISHPDMQNITT
ncbi:hypothetical protein GCM10009647_078150 [Streptomyces sanglieri]